MWNTAHKNNGKENLQVYKCIGWGNHFLLCYKGRNLNQQNVQTAYQKHKLHNNLFEMN